MLKFKFNILFCGEPLHLLLDKWILAQKKIMDIQVSFNDAFKYGCVAKFWSYVGTTAEPPFVVL